MSAGFNAEARAFIASYEELGLELQTDWNLPEKDTPRWNLVRRMIGQCEWLRDQRNNPLEDHTIPQILVMDLADEFLRWCAAADNGSSPAVPQWAALFAARSLVQEQDF